MDKPVAKDLYSSCLEASHTTMLYAFILIPSLLRVAANILIHLIYFILIVIPVKFSDDPEVPVAECHDLLQKSWQQFSKAPKVIQRLFIKYVCYYSIMLTSGIMVLTDFIT